MRIAVKVVEYMNFDELVHLSARELCAELLSAARVRDDNSYDIEQIINAIEAKIALGTYMLDELDYVSRVIVHALELANNRKQDLHKFIDDESDVIFGTAVVKGNGLELD